MWKEKLRNSVEIGLPKSSVELKHNRTTLGVSTLTNTEYCEQQAELNLLYPQIGKTDKIMKTGNISEMIISPLKQVEYDTLIEDIETKPMVITKFQIYSEIDGVVVGGVPDAVVFYSGVPYLLIEFKTGSPNNIWKNEINQLLIYRYLLEEMGFDCTSIRNLIVKSRSGVKIGEKGKKIMKQLYKIGNYDLDKFKNQIQKINVIQFDNHVHLIDYYEGSIINLIRRYLGLYTDLNRVPTNSSNLRKCESCIYFPKSKRFNENRITCPYFKNVY
ncbi:MAG: hypothetical protein OEY49_13415 [Candidatus Heimdallarchaeota archaeon]|nr:hypothetical protein [Candidatus Heimdallarchaeota archaeon]